MRPSTGTRRCVIHSTAYEVNLRLAELGIPKEVLARAVMQGELQRRLTTTDDFYATPGFYAWSRTYRELVSGMRLDSRWHKGQFCRIPVTYSADESLAIAVSRGSAATGDAQNDDLATTPKGPATSDAVESSQPEQPFDLDWPPAELWYLLYDSRSDGVWAELSRPTVTDDEDRVVDWAERIVIGRLDPEPAAIGASEPALPEIDIPVRRKSS